MSCPGGQRSTGVGQVGQASAMALLRRRAPSLRGSCATHVVVSRHIIHLIRVFVHNAGFHRFPEMVQILGIPRRSDWRRKTDCSREANAFPRDELWHPQNWLIYLGLMWLTMCSSFRSRPSGTSQTDTPHIPQEDDIGATGFHKRARARTVFSAVGDWAAHLPQTSNFC